MHYASDITRTIPVGGKFNQRQKDIYGIVLAAQEQAIESMRPGHRIQGSAHIILPYPYTKACSRWAS